MLQEAINFIYRNAKKFRRKHPLTIAFRLKAHSKILAKHLNNGEKIRYVFAAQKGPSSYDIFSTYVIAITDSVFAGVNNSLLFFHRNGGLLLCTIICEWPTINSYRWIQDNDQ